MTIDEAIVRARRLAKQKRISSLDQDALDLLVKRVESIDKMPRALTTKQVREALKRGAKSADGLAENVRKSFTLSAESRGLVLR